ncbi:hypothetical protein PUN28_013152 [Cardiocondyla obscurior]|uniref:Uncharacterized protein n=1 Tax=Cardiocondyla obscurior TaxID=286306 RepID=A0AAW2F9Q1_9HYME
MLLERKKKKKRKKYTRKKALAFLINEIRPVFAKLSRSFNGNRRDSILLREYVHTHVGERAKNASMRRAHKGPRRSRSRRCNYIHSNFSSTMPFNRS